MTRTSVDANEIAERIRKNLHERGMSAADLSRHSGVDASQVSRILAGSFKKCSQNVMQICTLLDVGASMNPIDGARGRIMNGALAMWDGTSEDADAIVALLAQIKRIRRLPQNG